MTASTPWPADSVERWPLAKLVPYARNARTHSRDQIAQIAASMREWGWTIPVLADEQGGIIAGHGRVLAAELNGYGEAPVMIARGWTEAKKRAYIIADNKLATNAGWDAVLLASEVADLKALEFDLALTGFNVSELDDLLAGASIPDEPAPPVPKVAASRSGDLWQCGEHRVLCGDACDAAVVERLLEGRRPILMVTDPPYGIELDSEWRDRAGLNGGPNAKPGRTKSAKHLAEPSYMKHRVEGHTETTVSGDTRADWSEAFALVPSLEVAYVWHASAFTRDVLNGLERIGFVHSQQIIWDKGRTVLTRTLYWFQHEPCWFVRKKNAPWYGKAGDNSTVWPAPSPKFFYGGSDEEKIDHPTQKPIVLMTKPIQNHLKRGEIVYEPFLGSGTTLAAAEQTGRVCCGIEIDPKYIDVIIERWQKLSGAAAVLNSTQVDSAATPVDGDGRTFEDVRAERLGGA